MSVLRLLSVVGCACAILIFSGCGEPEAEVKRKEIDRTKINADMSPSQSNEIDLSNVDP
jgi:hypothetical protein